MTDYNLPVDWASYSDAEKHEWFCQERTGRRFLRQCGISRTAIAAEDTRELLDGVFAARAHARARGERHD